MIDGLISAGRIPLNPNIIDYDDAKGHVVLWVKEEEEGHSVYMSVEMYGHITRTYEVRYDDFADVITRMLGEVTIHNANDPFTQLLEAAND